MENFKQTNGLVLAYVGDAVYDTAIRDYLVKSGLARPNHLHKAATRYVSAKAQAMLMKAMIDQALLSEEELAIYKRGRNTKSHTSAKNTDIMTYRIATGFEAVMGYLHLEKKSERLAQLIDWCIAYVGENNA